MGSFISDSRLAWLLKNFEFTISSQGDSSSMLCVRGCGMLDLSHSSFAIGDLLRLWGTFGDSSLMCGGCLVL